MSASRLLPFSVAVAVFAVVTQAFAEKPHASYSTQQAWKGRLGYYESCAECHGGTLGGQFGPALAGGADNLQYQSVKDVYAYMSAHMPHGNPESLPQEEYVDIMAFLMESHGIAAGRRSLTASSIAADATLMGNGR